MKIVFLGCTKFSEYLLNELISDSFEVKAVFSIPKEFCIRGGEKVNNSNYADLSVISNKKNIPFYIVDEDTKLDKYAEIISELKPDIILVLGWYYIIPEIIRNIPKYGACGIHASLLPKYAGWAPLVWAMINGEEKTGVTFFQFDESVDGGDIIAQEEFTIEFTDTIKEVYEKATLASSKLLRDTLRVIDSIDFIKQDKTKLEIWDKRTPKDGEIDLGKKASEIYNFVRAQSTPYPGAYIKTVDGKKLIIEKIRIEES